MNQLTPQIIVTLGPSTRIKKDLQKIKDKGVAFVRINMSHSSIDDLRYFINLAKEVGIRFIIDTEGSQIRTGELNQDKISFEEGSVIRIYNGEVQGDSEKIYLKPGHIAEQLREGDLIFVDFDTLVFRVSDTSTISKGYVLARVMTHGCLGRNKSAVVVSSIKENFALPVLTDKDRASIDVGLRAGIGHIALSFVRHASDIDAVRVATNNAMDIIAKIETREALADIDRIIDKADALLVDRGDLSKEIPIEKIPLVQKIILKKAKQKNKPVFIATNLLESMIMNKKPTRAEVNDVVSTILDGAGGLILSAETAIGNHPMECINMMHKLITHAKCTENVDEDTYLSQFEASALIAPHGGALIDRFTGTVPDDIESLKKIRLTEEQQMDVEQIAIGAFSPLEGFMCRQDFESVLDTVRLKNGLVWPIPIVLDVTEDFAKGIKAGERIALTDKDDVMAVMYVEDIYAYDKAGMAKKLYLTDDENHPGVQAVMQMKPVLLGGKIDLVHRRKSAHKEYELTPRQVRQVFEDRGWIKVAGFHTRNVIHRGHEFIQKHALDRAHCDGLFVHPVIGKKKPGDFHADYVIRSYEKMMSDFYPKRSVVFSAFATFSRYAGPREALFVAICRKNFGCSHFIVGRDHTGVGNFYHPHASHQIFSRFPDIGIIPITFDRVFYSNTLQRHVHEREVDAAADLDPAHLSGTEVREMMKSGKAPPAWYMRPEISSMVLEAIAKGEEVFVPQGERQKPAKEAAIFWFTGLSGSGKSTVADNVSEALEKKGYRVLTLDGDRVRSSAHTHLDFTESDIKENNARIADICARKRTDYDVILVPIISPYAVSRAEARKRLGRRFYEIYFSADLACVSARDAKGLYARAANNEITNMIGVSESNVYEPPKTPDLVIDSSVERESLSIQKMTDFILRNI